MKAAVLKWLKTEKEIKLNRSIKKQIKIVMTSTCQNKIVNDSWKYKNN